MFLPGEPQGQGSLVGCRLWGRTESDTTVYSQVLDPGESGWEGMTGVEEAWAPSLLPGESEPRPVAGLWGEWTLPFSMWLSLVS